jgi:protein-S-isoprenylcysteine O-methyltransferase Ste14
MPFSLDLVRQQWQRKVIVWIAVMLGIMLLMASAPMSDEDALWHETVERLGVFFIVVGVIGRTWCSMYIGGSKLKRLVTEGPYSMTRNPLYVFSTIAAFGLGSQLGSLVFALLCAAAAIAIFLIVISHEERALVRLFPFDYTLYKAEVPRFFPTFGLWRDAETISVRPALVRRTFFDALLFLFAVPLVKGLEGLRELLMTVPIFRLY